MQYVDEIMTQKIFANVALNDAVLLIGAFVFVLLVIGISMVLKKANAISGHTARKIVHLLCGLSCFIVPFLYYPWLALIISGLFLVVTRLSNPSTKIFETMRKRRVESRVFSRTILLCAINQRARARVLVHATIFLFRGGLDPGNDDF